MEENGTKTKVRPRAQDCPATRTQAIIGEDYEHAAGATTPYFSTPPATRDRGKLSGRPTLTGQGLGGGLSLL